MRHLRRWYVYGPITVAIIALLLWRTRIWEAGDLLRGALAWPLAFGVVLNVVIILCWAVRSRLLLAHLGHRIRVWPLIPIVTFANTINGLTPASAGEVVRAVLLHDRQGVPYRDGAAVIMLERVYALGLIAVSAVSCFAFAAIGPAIGAAVTIASLVLVALPTIVYRRGLRFSVIAQRLLGPLARRWRRVEHLLAQLASVEDQIAVVLSSVGATLAFIATTVVIFITMDIQLILIGTAIGVPVGPVEGWAALGLGAIAGVLSALPFGLGAADAVIAIVLVGFGIPATSAALMTVLMRLVGTLPTGVIGTLSYVYLNRTSPKTRSDDGRPGRVMDEPVSR